VKMFMNDEDVKNFYGDGSDLSEKKNTPSFT
jgi:hypothetical protein